MITPTVSIGKNLPYRGIYIEIPYPKIIIDENYANDQYVIAHEIFHHLNPNMKDGEEFEQKLKLFISETLRCYARPAKVCI